MPEEFAVDCPFGNGTTVDGKVFFALSWRIVMYYAWDNLLSHTAFSDYKHRQIGGRHLQGDVQRTV